MPLSTTTSSLAPWIQNYIETMGGKMCVGGGGGGRQGAQAMT